MSVLISDILRDGAGKPVQGCIIQLKAIRTSPTVVVKVASPDMTGEDGRYHIQAEPGHYSVSLMREGYPPALAGEIYVAPDSHPDTLNAFLGAPMDADLRPEALKRFEHMADAAARDAQASAAARDEAEQAAGDAPGSYALAPGDITNFHQRMRCRCMPPPRLRSVRRGTDNADVCSTHGFPGNRAGRDA